MGVPKFFRYISERYPCLSEQLKEYQIPEFDNLYLDMNGIIHNCSHPNDADVSFRITEETIFKNIFHYIEILFRIIQPQKLFFMAVDGVAPRAKINQQRGRRFRAAKEAEVLESKAKAKGQEIPKEARFDSNCITPGTVFMSKLNEQLKYFITYKISTDKLWQKCKIILSGSKVPGEGEHKIMDYIRYMKAQPEYEENTRHCLYGLDADLIMLGLCSHEPHFSLLREEVKFGKAQKKILTPEETNFCLLHLSLMREYLEHEFSPVKDKLTFKFDIEKIIDDWVLMGFLVGNDFIPHLPNLHIENNALPILYNAYMEILPTLDGYINEAGTLNLERFEKFMEKLGRYDIQQFDEIYADLKHFEAKTGRRLYDNDGNSKGSSDENASPKRTMNKALSALIMATNTELGESEEDDDEDDFDDGDDDDEDDDMHLEFVQHKRDYYMNKMEYANVNAEIMRSQAEGYIRAIQWNLHYYYNGCCSWSWYYPHHFAPFISDIKNFKDLKLEFDMGTPFLPFEQLLAVLPAASKSLLPIAYHGLMTEENSPIIEYYPVDFKTDLNGKKHEWEAVVLIPLIDEKSLLEAMKPCNENLTVDERKRNQHGPMSIFTYAKEEQGVYDAPEYFPSIRSHAYRKLVNREDILIPQDKLVKGLCKGVQLSVYYPGFPTLQHIPHTSCLVKAKVKVFEQPSRKENMILSVIPKEVPPIGDLARKWLGRTVFINWPHLMEALIISVSNCKEKISIMHHNNQQSKQSADSSDVKTEAMNDMLISAWNIHRKTITEYYKNRRGIDVGDIGIIVHACPIIGRQYVYSAQGKMTLEKQWNDNAVAVAYQMVLDDITVHNPNFVQYTSITDVFKPKSVCFMLGHPHYGAMGDVTESGVDLKTSRIKVSMRTIPEPNFDRVRQLQTDTRLKYMPGNIAAQRLGISSHLLSRITGTIFVINGDPLDPSSSSKHNIGLNLKFNKKNEEVQGFTKKDNGVWLYSVKAVELVRNYMHKYPELFERLEQNLITSDMYLKDLFPDKGSGAVDGTMEWLKEQQKALGTTTRACGTEDLEPEVVKCIEKEVDDTLETVRRAGKTIIMQVKPFLLYKPGLNSRSVPPDPKAQHRLLDRIICVRESFTVPIGYKGTIIGVQKGETDMLNMYEVLFDKPFAGGLVLHECSPNRSYRLAATDFINISYGIQIENKNVKVNVASPAWRQQQQQQQQVARQSPNFNNSRAPENTSWRQPQQPQFTQKFQAPDPSSLSGFYPAWTKNGQNGNKRNQGQAQGSSGRNQSGKKGGFNESPSHRRSNTDQVQQSYPLNSGPLVLLQRHSEPPGRKQQQQTFMPPPQQQQQQQQPVPRPRPQQGPSEFQAIWNELYKIKPKPTEPPPKQQVPKAPRQDRPNLPPNVVQDSTPQDPSAFLKAMLKISDESNTPQSNKPSSSTTAPPPVNKPAFPQTPKPTDNTQHHPLVQQLLDHARQAELKSGKSIWYGSELVSYFQRLGTGLPRYVYCTNAEELVCAQIILPDTRTFFGDFCKTHGEAAENTSKKVYEELELDKVGSGNARPVPLRPPPQQWFNNRGNNVRPPQPQPIPNIKPMLPAPFPTPFPQAPMMQIPMPKWSAMPPNPKWNPMMQQNPGFNNASIQQPMPQHQPKPPQQLIPGGRYPQPAPPSAEESIKKPSPFVPLQAQKKTRNPTSKPTGHDEHKQQNQQSNQQQQQHEKKNALENKVDQKPKENFPKEIKQEKLNTSNKSGETNNQGSQAQNAQKNQRTVRQRRSRVAAKFLSDPIANGGDRQ